MEPPKLELVTRHHEPFMYKNSNGDFVDGIEFHLIRTIAEKLHLNLEVTSSNMQLALINSS